MAKEKKKQHYVPRSYLEKWAIPGKYQVHVYNKIKKKNYIASIRDVASERYFYDIDFTDILAEEQLKVYGIENCDLKHIDDDQYIENFFAKRIEDDFKIRLEDIIKHIEKMNAWEKRNCYFISEINKANLSFGLAMQHIRVKSVRNSILDANCCLMQVLHDMGVSQEIISQHNISETQVPYIHGKMILNKQSIEELSKSYFSLLWMIIINKTNVPFFTSDNPIGTKEHIHHEFISMSGLQCRGVEAYFPINPNMILVMFDGEYHAAYANRDRYVVEIEDANVIKHYNSLQLLNCTECVFSNSPDFSIADDMQKNNPTLFNYPRNVMKWGNKIYIPNRM